MARRWKLTAMAAAEFKFLVGLLAVWRVTALLVYDDWFQWLRDKACVDYVDEAGEPKTFWGRMLACFWCTSVLVSILVTALLISPVWFITVPFALSGGAVLLNHLTRIFRLWSQK